MTLHKQDKGFTIVELLVVIIVIGILALITITTFSGVTQRARNANRESDVKAMHGQLEAFFANEGRYPTLGEFNNEAFRGDNMRGLDADALQDPQGDNNTLVATPTAGAYAYTVDPAACEAGSEPCTSYTLTATLEGGETYTRNALN